MNTQKLIDKLTSWPVTLTVCLLIVLGTLTVKLWPRTVPFDQCSVAYQTYASQPGIRAAFIKDYRINDTVFVDVTLLEAKDSAVWDILKRDFEVPVLPPDLQQFIDSGEDLVFTKLIPKPTPYATSLDTYKDDLLAISYRTRTLSVFHINNDDEKHAVKYHNFDKSTNQ